MESTILLALFIAAAIAIILRTKPVRSRFNGIRQIILRHTLTQDNLEKQRKRIQKLSAQREKLLAETRIQLAEFNCKFYDPRHFSYLVDDIPQADIREVQKNLDLSELYWQEAKFDKAVDFADFAAQSAAYLLATVNIAISAPPSKRPAQ